MDRNRYNPIQFRNICTDSSEYNGSHVSPPICTDRPIFGKSFFFFSYCTFTKFLKFDFFNEAAQCKKGINKPNVAGIIVLVGVQNNEVISHYCLLNTLVLNEDFFVENGNSSHTQTGTCSMCRTDR